MAVKKQFRKVLIFLTYIIGVVMRNILLIGRLQIETDITFMYERRRHVNRKIKSEHAQNNASQHRQVLRRN